MRKGIWYRNRTWSAEIASEFERKLKRTRAYLRPQFLRIQAMHLLIGGDSALRPAAIALLERVLGESDAGLEAPYALELLSNAHAAGGDLVKAEICLRESLSYGPAAASSGTAELNLAELILATRQVDHLEEARRLLDRMVQRSLSHRSYRFRVARARAMLASAQGRGEEARQEAREALRIASNRPRILGGYAEAEMYGVTPEMLDDLAWMAQGPTPEKLM